MAPLALWPLIKDDCSLRKQIHLKTCLGGLEVGLGGLGQLNQGQTSSSSSWRQQQH